MDAVLIVTYNEAENISLLIPAIHREAPLATIIVVDDDSPDGTAEIARKLSPDFRLVLKVRDKNRGFGPSILEGLRLALEMGAGRVVTIDADFSHDPRDIPRLLEAAHQFDLVVGSRYAGGIRVLNWQFKRLLLSLLANVYVRFFTGLPIYDCTSGFRCYSKKCLEEILNRQRIRSKGYAFQVEILYSLHRKKLRLGEVPIVFSERREGESKMSKRIVFEAALLPFTLLFKKK